jgi:sugar O-acyltransferase (sialic acid O-acetyltransferase NeuD family)
MIKPKIILIGGGGHCKSCIDVIEQENKFQIAGIIDLKEKIGQKILDYSVIGCDDDIPVFARECNNFIVTVGQIQSPQIRIHLFGILSKLNINLPVIISPLAYVSVHASIGKGTLIMHQSIVNAGATVGVNCIINTKALIEHDVVIGDHCHISTGSIVNGGTNIGSGTFFGSGAVSKEYISIPENSFIKANSIVK